MLRLTPLDTFEASSMLPVVTNPCQSRSNRTRISERCACCPKPAWVPPDVISQTQLVNNVAAALGACGTRWRRWQHREVLRTRPYHGVSSTLLELGLTLADHGPF